MFNDCYRGKSVLVTGHTGFKGSWLAIWLTMLGAKVTGFALEPASPRGNYAASRLGERLHADLRGDVRDIHALDAAIREHQPEFIFHLASQALVRTAYQRPRETFETNLMGSLNVLECVRRHPCVKYVVMITSDKCYENVEQIWGYRETDRMGGFDPYSASKGCAELMISSWRNSYFPPSRHAEHGRCIASVRAGNVIGGGDWSEDRLIPDCIRALESGQDIEIRSPRATRPWEHVLEPVSGYLRLGQKMTEDPVLYADCFNFGPQVSANKTVMEVVARLVDCWGEGRVVDASDPAAVHENTLLSLDVTKSRTMLGCEALWGLEEAVAKTADWYRAARHTPDMYDFCVEQIREHGVHLVC
jgi:CDP-glucose 4,6-dehydratase